jgi:hypothetical protein
VVTGGQRRGRSPERPKGVEGPGTSRPSTNVLGFIALLTLAACAAPPSTSSPPAPLDAPLDTATREWVVGLVLDDAFQAQPLLPASALAAPPPEGPLLQTVAARLETGGPFLWSCMEAQHAALAAGLDRGLDPDAAGIGRVAAAVADCRDARGAWRDASDALQTFSTVCRRPGRIRDLAALVRCLEDDASPSHEAVGRLARAGRAWRSAAAAARLSTLTTGVALAGQLLGAPRLLRPPVPDALWSLLRTPAEFWLRLEPDIPSYQALRDGQGRYLEIVRGGGWAALPPRARSLKKGSRGAAVEALAARLAAEGYLPPGWSPPRTKEAATFDGTLANALGRFQVDHGLPERRRMDRDTLRRLDEPAVRKLARLRRGLRRVAAAVGPVPGDLILVQAPAAVAAVYLDGRLWRTLRVVLGSTKKIWDPETRRSERPQRTPELASAIDRVVLNPEWLVPEGIKEKEYDPRLIEDPAWYETHGFRIKTYGGGRELLIQEPGPGNALGRVKFLFPNPYGVYLHDTPAKRLFRKRRRLFSHGCVRVEDALELAAHVLARDQGWTWDGVRRALARDEPTAVTLRHPVHVRIVYLTVDAFPGRTPRWIPDWYEQEGAEIDAEVARLKVLLGE